MNDAIQTRTRGAAAVLGTYVFGYTAATSWYLYHDFLKFLHPNAPMGADVTGLHIGLTPALSTVLSPWRVLLIGLTVVLLSRSARRLWTGNTSGRPLALITLWGLVLPQMFWFAEFACDWGHGGIASSVLGFAAATLIPTAMLFEGEHTLGNWHQLGRAGYRVLGLAVGTAWMGFAATQYLDHFNVGPSGIGFAAAMLTIGCSVLGVRAIFRLRGVGIAAAGAAGLGFAVLLLTRSFGPQAFAFGHGHIDGAIQTLHAAPMFATLLAFTPMLAMGALAWPMWRRTKVRSASLGPTRIADEPRA